MKQTIKMKGGMPSHHGGGLLINLDNFESEEAINSPYVLTSPRSLKACKKTGIKVCPR